MYPVNNVEPLLLFPNSRPGWDAGLKKKSRDLDWPWAFTYRKFYKGLGWGVGGGARQGFPWSAENSALCSPSPPSCGLVPHKCWEAALEGSSQSWD